MGFVHDLVERHEGRRKTAYKDTKGITTIGVGRNLDFKGLSDAEIDLLYQNDLKEADQDLFVLLGTAYAVASEARQAALMDMRFNLGAHGFRGFHRMIDAIMAGDWDLAADEAAASQWAKQVPNRAMDDITLLRTGVIP